MDVRVFQPSRDVKRLGKRKAEWYIEWRDPLDGRKRCSKVGAKKEADDAADALRRKLVAQKHGLNVSKPWSEFVDEYKRDYIQGRMTSDESREDAIRTIDRFTKAMDPKTVNAITEVMVDKYVAKRSLDRGLKKGDLVSAATIRKELRTLRATFNVAKRWKYIEDVPEIPKVKGIEQEKRYVTMPHFEAMLRALEQDPCPVYLPFSGDHGGDWTAAEWWRALLLTVWITGMRKGALLSLQWEDVDLETGRAVSRGQDNKGKRPHPVKLGPVIPLLEKLKGDDPRVFPCDHWKTTFDEQYRTLQVAAGIHLPCVGSDQHECTRACNCYCFHDFRRAHATHHYGQVSDRDLQQQMGHAAFSTTRSYIKYAEEHAEKAYAFKLPAAAQAAMQGLKLVVAEPIGGPREDNDEIALQKKKA